MNAPGAPSRRICTFLDKTSRRKPPTWATIRTPSGCGPWGRISSAPSRVLWSMACSPNPLRLEDIYFRTTLKTQGRTSLCHPHPNPFPWGIGAGIRRQYSPGEGLFPFPLVGEGWDEGERPRLTPHLYLPPQGGRWWPPSRGAASDAIHDGARHRLVRVPPLWLESSTP